MSDKICGHEAWLLKDAFAIAVESDKDPFTVVDVSADFEKYDMAARLDACRVAQYPDRLASLLKSLAVLAGVGFREIEVDDGQELITLFYADSARVLDMKTARRIAMSLLNSDKKESKKLILSLFTEESG